MACIVRAFPLIRPLADLHTFFAELRERKADTDAFYREYGVSHESVHLQETPHGVLVIVVTTLEDVHRAAPRYQAASAGSMSGSRSACSRSPAWT